MLGAITGDIIGSRLEFLGLKRYDFELFTPECEFTDDSVLTFAVAEALLDNLPIAKNIKNWATRYPGRCYGGMFAKWIHSENDVPYNSFGNGSAMRVSSVGWLYKTIKETLEMAKKTAEVTHNHPEGIKGAQATTAAIFLARNNKTKSEIKEYISQTFDINLNRDYKTVQANCQFDETCQISVPEAIIAFLESTDFEDAIRKSVAMGGDVDTQACITGSIAEAFYKGIPIEIEEKTKSYLNPEMTIILEPV